jgi:pimeloyl-ACP methyl ester carboxylesterase
MRVVFIHGACVKDGAWWWHPTAYLLAQRGIESAAPPLPSCGETGMTPNAEGPGLRADVASVRTELLQSNEPTVVVGHSYGGIVAAQAAADVETVKHIVLISSYLPEVGESLSTFGSEEPAPFLGIDPDAGTFTVRADMLVDTFLQDCPAEIGDESANHVADQSLSVLQQPVEASAWHTIPTTYIVCAADGGTPAVVQREFAKRANTVVEFDAGHHPFLSRPDLVADLLANLVPPSEE